MSKKVNLYLYQFLPVFIIIAGIILRLIKLQELFHFTYDEEIFAFVGKRMFVNHHIPLIGGVTPLHVHVAPYFYWLSGVWLSISKLNPLGWGILAAIIAAITLIILYVTTKKLFNTKIALTTITLASFSFYQNLFDRHYWGLVFDGLISLSIFMSLFEIVRGKYKYIYLLAISLAFGIHTDLSILTLFVLTLITWLYFRPKVPRLTILFAASLFCLSFLPLLLFDVKHDFSNSRGILQYIQEVKQGRKGMIQSSYVDTVLFVPRTLTRLLYVFGDTDLAKQYSYCSQYALGRLHSVPNEVATTLFFIIGILLVQKVSKTEKEFVSMRLLQMMFVSVYIGVIIYGAFFKGDLFDHYLATLFPIFFILIGWGLSRFLKNPLPIVIILTMWGIVNVKQTIEVQHKYGYLDKIKAVEWTNATIGDRPFALDVIGDCFKYNGYRYLFLLHGKEPAKSYVDANFTYLYDRPPAYEHPPYLVVFTNPDYPETNMYYQEYAQYQQKLFTKAKFGTIEVLIIDNSHLDFVGKF